MIGLRAYYRIKPLLPSGFRLAIRRWFSTRKRKRNSAVWPILPGSETPPADWRGWPGGKQFAMVLTHDVEGPLGLSLCLDLAQVEERFGFRSSFNFIPEGSYRLDSALRLELVKRNFEVGVHDLHHDGHLYSSRKVFTKSVPKINEYLKTWDAVGFRAGFMFHNLEWAHDLEILYDCSTFDTDPFEPQPDGVNTIFPFWVERTKDVTVSKATGSGIRQGYVELPYTVCQDSTLFLLLEEQSVGIWQKKIDWIVHHGGMVLFNTHPDYMDFNNQSTQGWVYPLGRYETILQYIQTRYAGAFWHALPRELAAFWRERLTRV